MHINGFNYEKENGSHITRKILIHVLNVGNIYLFIATINMIADRIRLHFSPFLKNITLSMVNRTENFFIIKFS